MRLKDVIEMIESYKPQSLEEQASQFLITDFLSEKENHFSREHLDGHVTASAWIINSNKTHALMIYHKFLDKWLCPGGHCDGEPNVQKTALREAEEETGVKNLEPIGGIFDVDVHTIPHNERKKEPEHLHYDIRFLFVSSIEEELSDEDEGVGAVRWMPLNEIKKISNDESILRMVEKTEELDLNTYSI